eukprot:9589506-Heterocapsa_arctica.AAC.1
MRAILGVFSAWVALSTSRTTQTGATAPAGCWRKTRGPELTGSQWSWPVRPHGPDSRRAACAAKDGRAELSRD